jgi:putative tryptophan/tyrosine transport system substrate-binding protein
MIRRRDFITLLGGATAAWPLAARAQQLSPDRPIVGVLAPQSQAASARNIEAFRKGLRDLGYVEGRNITLEIRYGDGLPERLPQLAAELVALKPAVIRAGSTAGLVAVHNATQTIPLVGATLEDPVALGLVKSISRPGTNVTGTWLAGDDALVSKRLGLLKDVVPGVSRVAAIVNPGDSSDTPLLRLLPTTAHALGLELFVIEARGASELPIAFANVARDGVQALFISSSPLFTSHRREIVATAARVRLPAIYGWREFPEAGGLVSYGPSLPDLYRQSATIVDKILKGANPADLPVEVPTRFELVVNLKTAKALGLKVSEPFLLLADEVIE